MRFRDAGAKREAAKAFRRSQSVAVSAGSMLATSTKREANRAATTRRSTTTMTMARSSSSTKMRSACGGVFDGRDGSGGGGGGGNNDDDAAFPARQRSRVTLIAFLQAIAEVYPDWWLVALQGDLVGSWRRCQGRFARFVDDVYLKPHESISVGRHSFAESKLLNARPHFATRDTAMEKMDAYRGPFPTPRDIAKEARCGVAEAMRRFEVPARIRYHPCRSVVLPYPSFSARDITRSAREPEKSLELRHIFGFETQACFGSNLVTLDENTIVYSVSTLVVVHDIEANTQRYFLGHDGQVSTLAMSKSGKLLASGQSSSKPYFLIWSAADGKPKTWTYQKDDQRLHRMRLGPQLPLEAPSVLSVAFSPDEKFVVAVGSDGQHMMGIWSVDSGDLLIEKGASKST